MNHVVPHEQLVASATGLGHDIGSADPDAVRALKDLYDRGWKRDGGDAIELELDVFRNRRLAPETIEARRASVINRNREA